MVPIPLPALHRPCSEPRCAAGWAWAPEWRLIQQPLRSTPEALGPRSWGGPLGSLTSNWISTVPLSRPFFSCSMDPSKVPAPSGHTGKMAAGKSWFSSSSDLISAKVWTAVADKKGRVGLWSTALAISFLPRNYTDTWMQMVYTILLNDYAHSDHLPQRHYSLLNDSMCVDCTK